MREHFRHPMMWMCGLMVVVAVILLATGAGVAILFPVVACVLMMGVMMGAMGMFASKHHGEH